MLGLLLSTLSHNARYGQPAAYAWRLIAQRPVVGELFVKCFGAIPTGIHRYTGRRIYLRT
jgi:hypothetical protein